MRRGTPVTPPVNLYLIGFMGVGKSAVGRGAAQTLGLQFLDSDREIELKAGKAISEIFAHQGEPAFRQLERQFVESGHPATGCVVSCGGGLPVQEGMREALLARGVVVCLFASEKTIVERTARNNKRPLLQVEDPEARVRALLAQRLPVYMKTGTGICTENRSLMEVTEHVIRVYRSEAARFAKAHPSLDFAPLQNRASSHAH